MLHLFEHVIIFVQPGVEDAVHLMRSPVYGHFIPAASMQGRSAYSSGGRASTYEACHERAESGLVLRSTYCCSLPTSTGDPRVHTRFSGTLASA